MKRYLVFILLIFFGCSVFADEVTHLEAARELIQISVSEESYNQLMEQSLDMQIQMNPEIEPFRGVMMNYMQKYMSLSAIIDDLAQIYVEYFTEEELHALCDFYRTDLGKKAQVLMPVLFQRGAEIGQRKVEENSAELQTMIIEEMMRQGEVGE